MTPTDADPPTEEDVLDRGERRRFPIMFKPGGEKGFVPWEIVSAHADRAEKNHGQTVERLAERGGLGVDELAAVLTDTDWSNAPNEDEAWRIVLRELLRHDAALREENERLREALEKIRSAGSGPGPNYPTVEGRIAREALEES